jgi:DNA polymerase-3 subunit gamma/tau
MEKLPLHNKLRPQTLDDVIGQDAVVANLRRLFESQRVPHAYLFTGPAGTGKTTLARIIAGMVGAGVVDVDAARYSTVDTMRELLVGAQYVGLGRSEKKIYNVDECHRLSKQTWDTLLLTVEEPRDHLYWVFCTTEPDKVPKTIITRCHAYDLKPVRWDLLAEYLEAVRVEERLQVSKEFVDLAARKAQGSVRQALVFLSLLDGIVSKDDALRLVEDAEAVTEGPVVLARMLCGTGACSWALALQTLEGLKEISPETIRITVVTYAAAVLANTKQEDKAARLLAVLQAFSVPCNPSERMAPVLLAVGGLLLGG